MRIFLLASAAALTLVAAPSLTYAACNIGDDKIEQELSQVKGISSGDFGNVRRDVRTLRSAAAVLQRYGKDEACQQVVATMGDLLRDPKASLDLRNKSASATLPTTDQPAATADQPAATAEAPAATQPPKTDAETTASTDPATTSGQPAVTPATPSDPQTTASTDPAAPVTTPTPSMTMEQRRTNAVPFMERKTVMSAAELIGTDIYGTDNNSIGEIEDVIVSPENEPSYALISYGGFLGIGEDQAAVPVSVLRVSADNYIFVPMTADQLKGAPKLKRGTADWWTNDTFRTQNDQYYTSMK